MSLDISTFALFSLQQVLTSIGDACIAFKQQKKPIGDLITDVDWLMNQLIRGGKEDLNPFLQESDLQSHSSNLDNEVSKHASRVNRMAKPNIVVIDDQESVAVYLCKTLQDFALNVTYYKSVFEFKKALPNIEVDLVLLDIVMPDIEQNEVFTFAAQLVKQGIKVISCSGKFTFETRLLAVRANVSDYVVKPINIYVLVEKIGRALGLQKKREHHIVMIDDQASMGTFYKTMLEQKDCHVTFFSDANEMFSHLDDLNPDMFLLDMMMPEVDGLEVAKMIRQEHKFDFAPILFLTGDETIENRLSAINAGADDVIAKSASINTITSQVITRLNRASKVRAFVAKDPLTGVLNHGQIVETANQTIRLSKRRKTASAIAVIDVDRFKQVNDNHGHLAGDKVLTALGQLLSSSVRDSDSVGRYGGEEFVIIFHDCEVKDAASKVLMIKDIFSNMRFSALDTQFNVSFSAGVTSLTEFDNVQPAVAMADKALYKAKNEGRNKVITIRP